MVTIRPARHSDAADLLEWRNDPVTRAASAAGDVIEQPEHEAWFARVLADPDRTLLVGTRTAPGGGEASLGMCRFDRLPGGEAEVSINLNPVFRGQGLSEPLLLASIAHLRESGCHVPLIARIRPENTPSVRLFESAGFIREAVADGFARYRRDA